MKKQKAPTVGAFLRLMPISHILNVSRCKYKRHYFVEVLDELDVRYFVTDADQEEASLTGCQLGLFFRITNKVVTFNILAPLRVCQWAEKQLLLKYNRQKVLRFSQFIVTL